MSDTVRIALAQMDPKLGKTKENLETILGMVREAAKNRANLVVFPECSLSGYVYKSKQEALPYVDNIPGVSTEKVAALCKEARTYVIYGLLENAGDKLYNALAFVGPDGVIGLYRKNHLPYLGIDRFVDPGNKGFPVFSTPIGNIGMHICYDLQFPESARVMGLTGADIIVLSTNFPEGRAEKLNCLVRARAVENKVHVASCDRVGSERGFDFDGFSTIINSKGDVLVTASHAREEIIYADVSLAEARQKRHVFIPGEWEIDNIASRRPELYGIITQKKRK
jgi:predicted amidohydrolase